jgi:hypothetical protein
MINVAKTIFSHPPVPPLHEPVQREVGIVSPYCPCINTPASKAIPSMPSGDRSATGSTAPTGATLGRTWKTATQAIRGKEPQPHRS